MDGTYPLGVGEKRGILERMAEFRKLYKLVDFVHDQNHQRIKDFDLEQLRIRRHVGIGYVSEQDCLSYLVSECKLSNDAAQEVIESALSEAHGYLNSYQPLAGAGRTLAVTPGKGMDFIKRYGFFRAGMWKDFQELYTPYTVAMSLLAILVSVVAIGVGIYAANHH